MQKIFHWFYCLPIPGAVTVVCLATVLYGGIYFRLRRCRYWKAAISVFFALWVLVILYGTLGQREAGAENGMPVLSPFYSYFVVLRGGERELLRENLMNVILFYPAGLLGSQLLPTGWKTRHRLVCLGLGALLFSVGIEYCQCRFALGLAETDDVLHNTLGTLAGGGIWLKIRCICAGNVV